jgi:hypothetical protein
MPAVAGDPGEFHAALWTGARIDPIRVGQVSFMVDAGTLRCHPYADRRG